MTKGMEVNLWQTVSHKKTHFCFIILQQLSQQRLTDRSLFFQSRSQKSKLSTHATRFVKTKTFRNLRFFEIFLELDDFQRRTANTTADIFEDMKTDRLLVVSQPAALTLNLLRSLRTHLDLVKAVLAKKLEKLSFVVFWNRLLRPL